MSGVSNRPLSDLDRWVSQYESFVDQLRDGYPMGIYEYTNDLACRDRLEDSRGTPSVSAFWARVESSDRALRELLLPTTQCIHGDHPESRFWYWGYPRDSPELDHDLRSRGAI